MNHTRTGVLFCSLLLLVGCHDRSSREPARLLVTASTVALQPEADPAPEVDLKALGADRVEAYYRATTPQGEPFCLELVSWRQGAGGPVHVSIAHLADGEDRPAEGTGALARAGVVPLGTGLSSDGGWLSASGDGFVRLTLAGKIERDQLVAVGAGGTGVTLVAIAIGPPSAINQASARPLEHPGVVDRVTLYSSDAWAFGLPTVAVSGDRTSIVVYEGDRLLGMNHARFELRLQHDRATGAVTGGGSIQAAPDSGHWRDHECAALYNVLVVARSEADCVRVRLSFDRGATFEQEALLDLGLGTSRLAQVALAADYSLAVTHWVGSDRGLEFRLLEGRPSAYDPGGSPTWYAFDPPRVLSRMPADSAPLTTGMAWSSGGDLVLGYAASRFEAGSAPVWTSITEFRCAVRPWGGAFVDRLVDEEIVVGRDPSVAVLGQGASLKIFYAYETASGIRLATSQDAGQTYALGPTPGASKGRAHSSPTRLAG